MGIRSPVDIVSQNVAGSETCCDSDETLVWDWSLNSRLRGCMGIVPSNGERGGRGETPSKPVFC